MRRLEREQFWSSFVLYATTYTLKTLKAAPGVANRQLVITHIQARVRTSAAQAVVVTDESGTINLMNIPASSAAGTLHEMGPFEKGIALTLNEALTALSTAGPAIDFMVEG